MKLTVQRFDPSPRVRVRNVDVIEDSAFALIPYRFPFLVERERRAIHEPALLFLLHHFRNKARNLNDPWKAASAEARAYDLKDWFQLLGSAGLDWTQADDDMLTFYITAMILDPSPRTGREIEKSTIGRRLDTVYKFYSWARGRYCDAVFDRSSARAVYDQPEAEAATGGDDATDHDEVGETGRVRPMMPEEYRRLLPHLGPKPSDLEEEDLTSCRCRLAVDLSVHTGLRVDEVAKLTRDRIMALRPDPDRPAGACALKVTLTKRLVPRTVRVPNWLVEELHLYDKRERRRCLNQASARWLAPDANEPKRFFVNTLAAGPDVGKGIQKRTLQDDFRKAVIAAGLTGDPNVKPGEAGDDQLARAAHTFHDCRHTFAVWMYAALTREINGRPAWFGGEPPWKVVQKQLGHKDEQTTKGRYLTFTEGMTADIGDLVVELFGSIRDGS